ncbi:uncharacterized protein B0I36DRAFT_353601 [Microdochium trichocladiopsis]|uniref:Biotin-protein ligase N-terminal domain-containing protein n=1 Tax=Microdochium trichocladiopsis TaxID=1682393 RepID=A0A9P9BK63_9PEZI|nr:uncharacterized protein B0I36DRAFT_353601 [Microdochium trichocladiopsis]KAH7020861.1 hypothetical protein B0I36DRAFT_353601 [Microdochium trichocladiopsis]
MEKTVQESALTLAPMRRPLALQALTAAAAVAMLATATLSTNFGPSGVSAAAVKIAAAAEALAAVAEAEVAAPCPRADATPTARPKAIVYRGPASSEGCPEAIANLLGNGSTSTTTTTTFDVIFAGPNEPLDVTPETLRGAALYAHGGGPDLDEAYDLTRQYEDAIREFVGVGGGTYLGFCLGAYLAGGAGERGGGYGLLPPEDGVVVDGLKFTGGDGDGEVVGGGRVLGRYSANGDVAAAVLPFGKGWVGLVGPHPEADQSWFCAKSPTLHTLTNLRAESAAERRSGSPQVVWQSHIHSQAALCSFP